MTVVVLPVKYGPKAPPKVARRVKNRRRVPAPVIALPIDLKVRAYNLKARAYNLYLAASEIDETDIPAGLSLYEQALAFDSTLALAHTNLGNCHYRQGNEHLARRCYERALELEPRQSEALYNLGYLFLKEDNVVRSIPLLEAAVEADPTFADAWFNLGLAHEKRLGTSRSPCVHRCFQQFVKLAPSNDQWVEIARRHMA
jgi:tetratricopeptide (TPR) repeat protein